MIIFCLIIIIDGKGSIAGSGMASATPPSNGWKLLRGAKSPAPSVDCIAADVNL